MRIDVEIRCCLGEADTESLMALFATPGIEHKIPRNPENPGPGVVLIRWRFGEASPDDQKRFSDQVLSICRLGATLNELQ